MQTDGLMALAERYENDPEQSERLENLFQVIEENPDMMDLPLKEVDDPLLAEILEALRKPKRESYFKTWMRAAHPGLTEDELDECS